MVKKGLVKEEVVLREGVVLKEGVVKQGSG